MARRPIVSFVDKEDSMNFNIYLSLLVCLVGLGFYWFADPPAKVSEVGRIAFFAGLFVFLLQFGGSASIK